MAIKLFVADTLPKFRFTIVDENGDIVDLSSPDLSSAKCYIRKESATANVWAGTDCDCAIIDKPTGRIDYTIPAGGIATADSYTAQLELTFGSDKQMTERFRLQVEEDLKPAA